MGDWVSPVAVERWNDRVVVVLPFIDQPTFLDREEAAPLPWPEVGRWIEPLLAALQPAHALGLAHGNLRPQNVSLGEDGRVSLLDAGLARPSPMAGRLVGAEDPAEVAAMGHLPPERLVLGELGPAGDVYQVAELCVRLLQGRPPFSAPTLDELGRLRMTTAPDLAGVPEAVRGALQAALAARPEERPPTAEALARLLFPQEKQALVPPEDPDVDLAPGGRRRWGAWIIAALVLVGAGLYFARQSGQGPQATPSEGGAAASTAAMPVGGKAMPVGGKAMPSAPVVPVPAVLTDAPGTAAPPSAGEFGAAAPDAAVPRVPDAGVLPQVRVASTPPGARLMVDGIERGVTPWEGALAIGSHQIGLAHPGFHDEAASYQVTREGLEAQIDLRPKRRRVGPRPAPPAVAAREPAAPATAARVELLGRGEEPSRVEPRAAGIELLDRREEPAARPASGVELLGPAPAGRGVELLGPGR
ncbi:MAG: PEGA domain-containing protein [bacterium]